MADLPRITRPIWLGISGRFDRNAHTIVEHPGFRDLERRIRTALDFQAAGTVLVVAGPSGAGATAAVKQMKATYAGASRDFSPYQHIEIAARLAAQGPFRWKAFFEAGLRAIDDPISGQRRRASEAALRKTIFTETAKFVGADVLQTDFMEGMQSRSTRLLVVTKAHHILRRAPEDELETPLEIFHQLCNSRLKLPAKVVLSGNTDLLFMMHRSAEADYNAQVMHAAPIESDDIGAKNWLSVLKVYQDLLSHLIQPSLLIGHARELHESHRGLIGWLKRTLLRVLSDHESKDKDQLITWTDIVAVLPTKREGILIDDEIKTTKEFLEWEAKVEDGQKLPLSSRPRSRRRVGERNPSKDAVGRQSA